MYKITTKSTPMFVLPEPAAAGCHVAEDEDYNVLPQYCKTPCYAFALILALSGCNKNLTMSKLGSKLC
jgi:hypothetical protein